MGKKKKPVINLQGVPGSLSDVFGSSSAFGVNAGGLEAESSVIKERIPIFKDVAYVQSRSGAGVVKKTKIWKNLKQIVTAERILPWKQSTVTYGTIDAPPSFKPAKKYSDISGLPAKYTDPQTKLRFANSDEFAQIHMMSPDVVSAYLTLRKANNVPS